MNFLFTIEYFLPPLGKVMDERSMQPGSRSFFFFFYRACKMADEDSHSIDSIGSGGEGPLKVL